MVGNAQLISDLLSRKPVLEVECFEQRLVDRLSPLQYGGGSHRAHSYFVSLCNVCLRQRGQNFLNSSRFGSLRRFFCVV